ncbi:MAG TPA: phosphoribosylamine--glycine ligase, partial [Actinomycetota bacterium]|nr:phosphoribosylamine--glycine ligase [Actinomycetota bacterium]
MRVLVIGSGAREHALVMSLLADPQVSEVVAAPGNAGIAQVVRTEAVDVNDAAAIATLAAGYDLVVVGPEAPLVAGAVDACRAAGILAFGPTAAAARLEGSKDFAKEVMRSAGIPTADARTVTDAADLVRELDAFGPPYVVKDDGLAAGKGVVVTDDRAQALLHGEA